MSTATASDAHPQPAPAPSIGADVDLLRLATAVAGWLEVPCEAAQLRQQVTAGAALEPVEAFGRVADAMGLAAEPRRLPVADAVWLADDAMPVVAWCAGSREWLAIVRHGLVRARVWRSSVPDEPARAMSRAELARLLGVAGPDANHDFVFVHARLPAQALGEHGSAHDGAHAHGPTPIRRLLQLLRPEGPELWSIVIFSGITGVLYLALPLAVNAFISNLSFGTRSGPFVQGLVAIAVVLSLCLAIAAALRYLQHAAAEVIQRRIFVRLGADLSHRLPRVDVESIDSLHAPELVNRFLDVITVQKAGAMLLLTGINLVLGAAIGLTVLAFYHPFLLAMSLVLLGAVTFIVFVLGRGAVRTAVDESRRKYALVDWLEELARHPRVFKGPGGPALAAARADDLVRGYLDARRDHFRILMRQVASLLALEVLAAVVLLGVGGWLVLGQQLTLGQLVASEIILSMIVASISKLGKQFESWYDAVAAMDKLGHLVDLRMERDGGETVAPQGGGARVDVQGLAYARLGRAPSFEDVSFTVQPGERVALLASRGMGTSSILEMLLGMRAPVAGSISVDGLDVRNWDLDALRAQCCILRSGDLIAGTIAENVRVGRSDIPTADVQRAIESVGLGETVRAFPEGIHAPLVTGGLPLTGRQRARLLGARALAARPRLLLLDEVLDGHEGTLDVLARALLDAPIPWTVIVVTHDRRVAARCGRVIELGQEDARHA